MQSSLKKGYTRTMETKLNFGEVELNYILEAVQHFREHVVSGMEVGQAVYQAELVNIEERILDALDGE